MKANEERQSIYLNRKEVECQANLRVHIFEGLGFVLGAAATRNLQTTTSAPNQES